MATSAAPDGVYDDVALPDYLTRHITLGFNSDDITALLDSIDSSQNPETPALPRLPAEILFQILEYVPVDYVLTWRLVCRGFRDVIDGPVMFKYIKRAQLIGYLGSRLDSPLNQMTPEQYEKLYLVRADFERMEEAVVPESGARWGATHAIFRVDGLWQELYAITTNRFHLHDPRGPAWQNRMDRLCLTQIEEQWGTLRWCMRLDKGVVDLHLPTTKSLGSLEVNLPNGRIIIQWKNLLFRFLKAETLLRSLMEEVSSIRPSNSLVGAHGVQQAQGPFTFGAKEDCLRAARRHQLQATLNLEAQVDRRINWEMNLLRPLFGQPRYDKAASNLFNLERVENEAIEILSFLRREASLSERETAHLKQLAEDRVTMERDFMSLDSIYSDWRKKFSGLRGGSLRSFRLPKVPPNPIAWSERIQAREEERMRNWKSQEEVLKQVTWLLKGSIEALTLPDDAFDEIGSDF